MRPYLRVVLFIFFSILSAAGLSRAQGSLLLIGGGNDRKAWAGDPFRWFVQKADSGKIINIDADEVAESYADTFIGFGADSSSCSLRIATRIQADDSSTYHALMSASGIFIEGGDQYDYVRTWKGTLVEEALYRIFERGGVIGGTSAGLAVLGEVVFDAKYGGVDPAQAAYDPYTYRVHLIDDFLNLLPGVLTDSHFHPRARLGRLVPMMARWIQDEGDEDLLGLGVDENTALCVDSSLTGICFGEGTVTLLWKDEASRIVCQSGRPVTFTHIHYDQLIHGAVYDLKNRALSDPGPYLQAVTKIPSIPPFSPLILEGFLEETADSGEVVIRDLTGDDLNAWYGRLYAIPGTGRLPGSVIIPRVWSDTNFSENRWIGGMYGTALHPGYFTLYLDDGCTAVLDGDGRLAVDGAAYLLDTYGVSHTGFVGFRITNYPGLVNAMLHFLGPGDTLNLSEMHTGISMSGRLDSSLRNFQLHENYPNPFNAETRILYDLPFQSRVRLDILDMRGRLLTNLILCVQKRGRHCVVWNAGEIPSGAYFIRLRWPGGRAVRRCMLVK
jgi:cyanophycinase